MASIPGFENLEKLKKEYQWFDLSSHTYGPAKKGQTYVGGVPLLYDSTAQKVYVDSTDTHTLVYGATGSLKTRSIVMPAIKLLGYAGESLIINDAKGELYNRLAADLYNQGYNIVVINLRDPSKGNCWNPLFLPYQFYLKDDIDRACEFISDIAINLTNDEATNQDPFWDNSAADLTFGLILLLFKYCKEHDEDINAVNISNIISLRRELFTVAPGKRPKDTDIWKYASKDELIAARLSGSVFAPNDTMNSILSVFDNKMSIFSLQPTLLKMLANNDFDIADIGRKKTALFLVIPDEKTTFSALVSLFIKQSYEYLIFTAMQTGNNTVANRVNYCLDEFSALPSIADFPAMITAARSRDIRFLLIVQSQSSLKRKYKEDADTIIGNCSNWIFFTSRELGLLRELSELCGTQKGGHTPNISTYELQHFSKDKREALVLCGRHKPAKVNMIDIDNHHLSGGSYSILKIATSDRKERKTLSFDSITDGNDAVEVATPRNPFEQLQTKHADNPFGVFPPHMPDSEIVFDPLDEEYRQLLQRIDKRRSSFICAPSQSARMIGDTQLNGSNEPQSLEELLSQLMSDNDN